MIALAFELQAIRLSENRTNLVLVEIAEESTEAPVAVGSATMVARGSATLVQDELSSGRLVPILGDFEIVDGAFEIRLAYNSRTFLPAKVRAFVEHAAAFFEGTADA